MGAFTSKATGNWDAEGQTTWNEVGHPAAGDTVTVQNGHTVTLDSATAYTSLIIDTGGVVTDATNNQGITASEFTRVSGTLILGSAACSFGSGYVTEYGLEADTGGTITGGSGDWIVGSLQCQTDTSTLTMTSGTCTINTCRSACYSMIVLSTATFAHNNGTITLTGASTSLYVDSASQSVYNVIIDSDIDLKRGLIVDNDLTITSGIFSTTANDYDLTVTGVTSVTGTLTCNASTCSFGSGVTNNFALTVIGTFNGGSGTHTMGSFFLDNGTATFTSGVTTLDSRQLSSVTFGTENGTFNHGSGTITFTMANYQLIYDLTNTARTFYNLIINKASNLVQFSNSSGYTLTIANDFTITSGEFDTSERTGGASRNLVIAGNLSNAGTFTCNSGLVTLNGTTQTLIGNWTFWSFTKSVAAADTLTFDNTGTYTFGGNVTLNGASGELLSVLSDSSGHAFDFVMSAGAVKTNLSYLSVKDSDASGSDASQKPIAPTNSTFVSGNTDWESSGSVTTQSNQTIYNKYYY